MSFRRDVQQRQQVTAGMLTQSPVVKNNGMDRLQERGVTSEPQNGFILIKKHKKVIQRAVTRVSDHTAIEKELISPLGT